MYDKSRNIQFPNETLIKASFSSPRAMSRYCLEWNTNCCGETFVRAFNAASIDYVLIINIDYVGCIASLLDEAPEIMYYFRYDN